ncbi:MAG TPA: hypothetical protein VEA37_02110, partial [Flavobacterium sp.]|nr:hypothetical protein [Flavobacterium sp.]
LNLLGLGCLLFLALSLASLFLIDPSSASVSAFSLFYFSIAGFVFFASSFFLQILRKKMSGQLEARIGVAVREGFFLSVLVTGSLVLASFGLLSFWIAIIFALSLILLEAFFLI